MAHAGPCLHRCSHVALSEIAETQARRHHAQDNQAINRPPVPSIPSTHSCDPTSPTEPAYHVPLFPISMRGPVFPGEFLRMRVSAVSALYLFADVTAAFGLLVDQHEAHVSGACVWPSMPTHLLRRTIALSESLNSPYGALATFHPCRISQFAPSFILNLVVFARYRLVGCPQYHRSYPCVLVKLVCDSPPMPFPSDSLLADQPACQVVKRDATAFLTSRDVMNHVSCAAYRSPPTHARTRSQTAVAHLAAMAAPARPKPPSRLLSPVFPSYITGELYPPSAIARAHASMISASSCNPPIVNASLLQHPPKGQCPTSWSFWLCAALPCDVSAPVLCNLLAETSALGRLAHVDLLIRFLMEQRHPPSTVLPNCQPRKRRKVLPNVSESNDSDPQSLEVVNLDKDNAPSDAALTLKRKQSNLRLQKILKVNPWPCSSSKGFQRVNLRRPCLGHFPAWKPAFYPESPPPSSSSSPSPSPSPSPSRKT